MFDVTAALSLTQRTVQRVTPAAGAYDPLTGKWVEGAAQSTDFLATIQPTSGKQLKDLPEGVRSEALLTGWSVTDIQYDERILYNGTVYRVIHTRPWQFEGTYTQFTLGALGE